MYNTNILIASQSDTVSMVLRYLLENMEDLAINSVNNVQRLESRLALKTPDILLLETSFAGTETVSLLGKLSRGIRGLRIVAFSMEELSCRYAALLIQRGAESFVCLHASLNELRQAARMIYHGKPYMPLAVERVINERDAIPLAKGNLTCREREVGRLIAGGYTVRQIAEALSLSIKTVDTHKSHIYEKTSSSRKSDFVSYALQTGLIGEAVEWNRT